MNIVIKSIASYLPDSKLTNEMLSNEFPEWSVDKISSKIGIKERRLSGSETVSSMAVNAVKKLFESSQVGMDRLPIGVKFNISALIHFRNIVNIVNFFIQLFNNPNK